MLFGATGDLVKAKILPALDAIGIAPLLYGRKEIFQNNYIRGELNEIGEKLKDTGITHAYVALPPTHYEMALRQLSLLPIIPRIALEKPFGTSYKDAERLIGLIKKLGLEGKTYLVDHYLGKPALREVSLELQGIQKINIDVFETQNVATRGAFYDAVGTIKDFVQNHIMVIISTLLMPGHCDEDATQCRQVVLEKLAYKEDSILIAQYDGFTATAGVSPHSKTETFVSCEFVYDNTFSIHVRVGKALSEAKATALISYESNIDNHNNTDKQKEIIIQSSVNPYEAIISDFLSDNSTSSQFNLSFDEALLSWKIAEEVLKAKEGIFPAVYTQGTHPDIIEKWKH
jgi:glucose-6-phosphate 1-dehydrogenase